MNLMINRANNRLSLLALFLTMTLCLVSCSKNGTNPDENGSNNGNSQEPETPIVPTPDPEGTITVNLNNGASGNYYDIGFGHYDVNYDGHDYIHIDEANNFTGKNESITFLSLGTVDGLGSVTFIPTTGWAEAVAVIPGNGYIARNATQSYSDGNTYYYYYARLYVVDYITGTNNGIIGATVKYQYPFQP